MNESLKYFEFCFLVRTGCGVGRGVGLAKDGEVDGVGEAVEEEGGWWVGVGDGEVGEREDSGEVEWRGVVGGGVGESGIGWRRE